MSHKSLIRGSLVFGCLIAAFVLYRAVDRRDARAGVNFVSEPSVPHIASTDAIHKQYLESELQGGSLKAAEWTIVGSQMISGVLLCEGVSCSCAQIRYGERILKPKDSLDIVSGESVPLTIAVQLSGVPSDRSASADFTIKVHERPDQSFRLNVSYVTLADLEPLYKLVDIRTRSTKMLKEACRLKFTRRYRSTDFDTEHAPELFCGQFAVECRPIREARRQLDGDLVEEEWVLPISIGSVDFVESGELPIDIRIRFPGFSNVASIDASLRLVLREERAIESPKAVHFGNVQQQRTVRRRFLVKSIDDLSFGLVSVQCPDNRIRIQFDASQRAARHWIDCYFESGTNDPLDSVISLATTTGDSASIKILGRISE